jgi:hypothetical protein
VKISQFPLQLLDPKTSHDLGLSLIGQCGPRPLSCQSPLLGAMVRLLHSGSMTVAAPLP